MAAPMASVRRGKKLNGQYFIISGKESTTDGGLPCFTITLYSPSTSLRVQRVVGADDVAGLVGGDAGAMAARPARFGGSGDDTAAASRPFFVALVDAVVDDISPTLGVELPAEVVKAAQGARTRGNEAYLAKDLDAALEHYTEAVQLAPESMLYRMNRSAALVELGRHDEALAECKKVVAVGRRLQSTYCARPSKPSAVPPATAATPPSVPADAPGAPAGEGVPPPPLPPAAAPLHPHVSYLTGGQPLGTVVGKAYARMGAVFVRQNRLPRAVGAFTLAIKAHPTDDVKARLQSTVKSMQEAVASRAPPDVKLPRVADVEEILARHDVSGYREDFQFECTGCGECCRSADHIFLTPADIFRLSRSPALAVDGVQSTGTLRTKFKDALKYTTRELLPLCQLRPAASKLGRCHFAYPLHTAPETGKLLSFAETREATLVDYKPVDPSEYNLTEAEEIAALEEADRAASADDEDEDEEEDEGGSSGADATSVHSGASDDEDPEPVLNSFGRQALGCRLGRDGMPTMCSTYPIARELSWADFWHDTSSELNLAVDGTPTVPAAAGAGVEPEKPSAGDIGESEDNTKVMPDTLHLDEQQYVVVRTDGCEGFFKDGTKRTAVFGGAEDKAKTQPMSEFIRANGIHDKWREDDWFKALLTRLVESGVVRRLQAVDTRMAVGVVQALAIVWFDFDSLDVARKRPFGTWRRVKRTVESLTADVVAVAEGVLRALSDGGDAEAAAATLTADLAGLGFRHVVPPAGPAPVPTPSAGVPSAQ